MIVGPELGLGPGLGPGLGLVWHLLPIIYFMITYLHSRHQWASIPSIEECAGIYGRRDD